MKTGGKYLLRQEFSCARSAQVEYEIDWPERVVRFRMTTAGGQDFLNPEAVTDLVKNLLPERYGIIAFDQDSKNLHPPAVTEWRVVVALDDLRLRVRLIQPVVGGLIAEVSALNGKDGSNPSVSYEMQS